MQRHSRTVEPAHSHAETLWGMDPLSIEAVTRSYQAWFSQANRMRDEAVRFTQDRFTKELEAAVQLVRCTNPTDALTVQAEFASTMAAGTTSPRARRWSRSMGEIVKEVSPITRPEKRNTDPAQ